MSSRFVLASSFALLLASATPAYAQDAQTQAMGRALFNEGVALFNVGNYPEACPKFEASLKHYPGLGTRGKLAECYEKMGRIASAWQVYRDVAQLAARGGDPTREQVASERAKSLEPKLSYVTVTSPVTNDIPGFVIKRNGKEVDRAKLGMAEPVDSGTLAFEVSAPGRKTYTSQVSVQQGQSVRFEIPTLEATSSGVATTPPPVHDDGPVVHTDPPAWQKPVGLVMMGVGVVGLGVGSILGLSASSKYDGAFDDGRCDKATKTCDPSGQSDVDSAHSTATAATVIFVIGGALGVGGLVVYLTAPSSRSTGVRVTPTTHAGGGGLVISGSL